MLTGIDRFEIRVYNKAGAQQAFASSTGGGGWIVSAEFTLARIGGCTTATITSPRPGIPGTVACGYLLEFWAKPRGGSLTRYWRGEIIECPNTGNTADVLEYRAVGLMSQLSRKLVLKYYSNDDTDNIVTSLIGAEFTSDTDVDSGTGEVSVASPYALGDAEFEFISGAQALKLLAEAQKLVDYGVDEDGKVYFKDRDTTTVVERYWVGKHLAAYETADNMDNLTNSLLLQSKKVVAGGMLTVAATDATSITAYGERMKLEQIPHLSDPSDVFRMAEGMVANEKDPRTEVEADVLLSFSDFYFPTGAVVVTDIDGNAVTLPIQKTIYTLDSSGFRGRFELGDEPVLSVDEEMQAIFRDIDLNKQSQISAVKIEHTRGEEWRQTALIDAREQGNYNSWFGTFDDTKGIDQDNSYHVYQNKDRGFAGCSWNFDGSLIRTFSIPLGPNPATHSGMAVDTVRVHVDCDWRGRIDFAYDDDYSYFFNGTYADWKIRSSYAHLEPVNSLFTYYKDDGDDFVLPAEYNVRWGSIDMAAAGGTHKFRVGYKDANNYLIVHATNGTANFVATLYENVAGAGLAAVGATHTLTKDTDYKFEVAVRTPATATTFQVWDYADADQGTSSAARTAMTGMTQVGPIDWHTGAVPRSYLDYFDLLRYGADMIIVELSRDGGTTWTDASLVEGSTNLNVDISGQPIGTGNLLMRASMLHPVRLYGWGASWKSA